jgi:beta-glucosidase
MKKLKFPKNFLWGAATSAHQVEGGNIWNDWYLHEKAGRTRHLSGSATKHYQDYNKDFKLARKLGHNAQRVSIEWSRIEKSRGYYDKKELDHYKKMLRSLKNNDQATFVTLHHFTNPAWFTKEGLWEKKEGAEIFANYAAAVVRELGDDIDYLIILNEPLAPYATFGWLTGFWPPLKSELFTFLFVVGNLARAHKLAYKYGKLVRPTLKIGVAYNGAPYLPHTPLDRPLKTIFEYLRNFWFLDKIKNQLDFIGLNYYFPASGFNRGFNKTDMGWPIYPKGLYDFVMSVWKRYQKDIYITENGLADKNDVQRIDFINDHLFWLHKSIQEGAKVKGYLHWSLTDNFEWTEGFNPRFGLVGIDYKTNKRKIRKSAKHFKKICEENSLTLDK